MRKLSKLLQAGTLSIAGLLGLGIFLPSLPLAIMAAAFPQGEPFTPAWQVIGLVIGGGIFLSLGYFLFFFGFARISTNLYLRYSVLVLLAFPLLAGVTLIRANRLEALPTGLVIAVIGFTVWLILICIKPCVFGRLLANDD